MKLLAVIIFTLSFNLLSCGGGVDNSEQPANLINFTESSSFSVLKEINIGETSAQYFRITPLVLNNAVVFSDQKGLVSSFDKKTFEIIWQKDLQLQYPSSIGGDSTLYVIGTRSGEVIALEPETGKVIWRIAVSSEVLAKPAISNGIAVIKTVDGQITALNVVNGAQLWTYKRDIPVLSVRGNSSPVIIDDKIITGLDNGKLVILDLKSGVLFWEKTISVSRGRSEMDRLVDLDADLLIVDNVAFIAGFQGKVIALDLQTGDFLWQRKMSVINNITFESNKLYITDVRSHVWCLDATTGATIWKQKVFIARKLTSPTLFESNLLFADYRGYLHAISKNDGQLVARSQVDSAGVDIAPIVIEDKIYLQSKTSKIYILSLNKIKL